MSRADGVILWRGPSLIDGAPIVALAVGLASGSSNRKTGSMLQTYILRDDLAPTAAVKSGADASICGDCPHRGDGTGGGRTCYVNVGQGPLGVWKAYKRGRYSAVPLTGMYCPIDGQYSLLYPGALADIGAGRNVRLGTYGDPAAIPSTVWHALVSRATGHTGYTHQWRHALQLRGLCMASVDTEAEAHEAHAAGWRTFRVTMPGAVARLENEARCPASAEAGKKLQCAECLACAGTARGLRGSIVIQAHGGFAVMANVGKRAARMLAASHSQPWSLTI